MVRQSNGILQYYGSESLWKRVENTTKTFFFSTRKSNNLIKWLWHGEIRILNIAKIVDSQSSGTVYVDARDCESEGCGSKRRKTYQEAFLCFFSSSATAVNFDWYIQCRARERMQNKSVGWYHVAENSRGMMSLARAMGLFLQTWYPWRRIRITNAKCKWSSRMAALFFDHYW